MIDGPSQFDVDHVKEILGGHGDWWSAAMLRLIAKSDHQHCEALRLAAPEHVAMFERFERDGRVQGD